MQNPFFSTLLSNPIDILGHKTLVLGESGTGKTTLTLDFIEWMRANEPEISISILDFAPPILWKNQLKIGGTLIEIAQWQYRTDTVEFLAQEPWINAKGTLQFSHPRSTATNAADVYKSALQNWKQSLSHIERIGMEFQKTLPKNEGNLLIINDVTLFLHLGNLRTILKLASRFSTVFINAYVGTALLKDYDTNISQREQSLLKIWMKKTDWKIIQL